MSDGEAGSKRDAASRTSDAAFLRAVLEAVPAFITRLDADQRISYMNRLQAGFTLDDVIGRSPFDFVAPTYHDHLRRAIDDALRTGKSSGFPTKGAGPDGKAAYYESHAIPLPDSDGRPTVCLISLEVTEHVARALALKESEEKLRVAVEATGLGLWSWDLTNDTYEYDGRIIELVGGTPSSPAAYLAQFVHPDDRERVARNVLEAQAGEIASFSRHRVVRPDGSERWLMPSAKALTDDDGKPVRLIGGLLDVTEQRVVEERLRQAQKMDAVGSLTAGVAHNFNNMLAVILPALDLALPRAEHDLRDALENAMHATKRSAELIAQLMTFAGQRKVGVRKPQDLGPVVERAVSMCQRAFDRHLQLVVDIAPNRPLVTCDASAIEQAIVNLLINARDAVAALEPEQPSIVVEVGDFEDAGTGAPDTRRRWVRIRVTDNGIGMSMAVQSRAFEPFFTTKELGKGTGLGLATSYGIVRDHGGSIALHSQEQSGTVAEILLPVAGAPQPELRSPPPAAAGTSAGTILVVDDEPAVRRVIELVLGERGHRVVVAGDGQSAVATLAGGLRPDLILLDRSMPGWSPRMTLQEIRKLAPDTPLLFFTGQDVTADERAQVQDVLYKPLAVDELVREVERWMQPR